MSFENPNFTHHDIPLNEDQLRERESWMMESGNWRNNHSIPSAGDHYRYMWKWDSLKAAVINARRGNPDKARTEIETLERYRDRLTGFMPNKIFATATHKTWRDYPEAWNFNNNKVGTSYSQPPIEAWAAMETYRSFAAQNRHAEGLQFLKIIYGSESEGNYTGLQGEYAYFINHRQNDPDDPLIGIVHPNETGRDSDEANKPWLLNKKNQNPIAEWLHMQKLGYQLGRLGRKHERIDWVPEQVRHKYWVNDVMFNAMHVSNLRYLADIATILSKHDTDSDHYHHDASRYRTIATEIESHILNRMWDPSTGFFYNLDQNGDQIPIESITGLFPLILDNITDEQTIALIEKLEDPKWFATPYPIPTHATRSAFYDPDPSGFKKTFTPPWSGAVWISTNQLIVEEGLVPIAERFADPSHPNYSRELAKRALQNARYIADKTRDMLAINPKSMECYSATTGTGIRVEDFMWSNIGLHFEKTQQAEATIIPKL